MAFDFLFFPFSLELVADVNTEAVSQILTCFGKAKLLRCALTHELNNTQSVQEIVNFLCVEICFCQ